jgi:hypothetical protein
MMQRDGMPPEIQALFASYRNAVGAPDATPDFLPGLWTKIEQKQRVTYSFRRIAQGFVTAAAALCLMLSVALWTPLDQSQAPASTYVDVLADDADSAAVTEMASVQ